MRYRRSSERSLHLDWRSTVSRSDRHRRAVAVEEVDPVVERDGDESIKVIMRIYK